MQTQPGCADFCTRQELNVTNTGFYIFYDATNGTFSLDSVCLVNITLLVCNSGFLSGFIVIFMTGKLTSVYKIS